MADLWKLLMAGVLLGAVMSGPGAGVSLFAEEPGEMPVAEEAFSISPETQGQVQMEREDDVLEVLDATATEAGAPARIKVRVPALPERYHLEVRLAPEDERARAEDVDLPPVEMLREIRDQAEPVLEIHAWDDVLAEDSEWASLQVFLVGTSQSGQAGEKLLGSARLRLVDDDLDPEFGRIAWYRWLRGYPYDYSGLGNHGQIENARYTEGDGRAALVFSGDGDFVQISASLENSREERGGAGSAESTEESSSSEAPEPGALGQYSFLHSPLSKGTICLWFQAEDTFERQVIYEEGDSANGRSLLLENGDLVYRTAGGGKAGELRAAVDAGEWVHVAAVFDEGQLRLYINGMLWDSAMADHRAIGFRAGGASLSRGSGGGPGAAEGNGFAGMIGESAFYDRALAKPQVFSIVLRGQADPLKRQ